jgi:hypothetical protein
VSRDDARYIRSVELRELMFVYPPILVEQWRPISLHTNTWIVHSATECVPSKM